MSVSQLQGMAGPTSTSLTLREPYAILLSMSPSDGTSSCTPAGRMGGMAVRESPPRRQRRQEEPLPQEEVPLRPPN